jgi:hypothetical protein
VQDDPATLYAAVCSGATNKAVFSGEFFDPRNRWSNPDLLDSLQHKVQTIKLVNQGLSNPVTASSDGMIAAVSILIAIEVRDEFLCTINVSIKDFTGSMCNPFFPS